MTTILSPTRARLFDIPHKALRNLLAQTSLLAGSTDYRHIEQIERLHALATKLFRLLTDHAEHENNVTLAELEARAPGAAQHNLDDHDEIEHRQVQLEKMIDEIRAAAYRGADVRPLGDVFYRALNRFQSAYLLHMLEEEEETQVKVWQNFSDAEIQDQHRRIIATIDPAMMLITLEFTLSAQPHPERVRLLRGMRAGAPPAFFAQAMVVAGNVLPKDELAKLEAELQEVVFA